MNYQVTCIITCEYDGDDYILIAKKSSSESTLDTTTLHRCSRNEYDDDELVEDDELLNKILDLLE